jgi:hypothetical protein
MPASRAEFFSKRIALLGGERSQVVFDFHARITSPDVFACQHLLMF